MCKSKFPIAVFVSVLLPICAGFLGVGTDRCQATELRFNFYVNYLQQEATIYYHAGAFFHASPGDLTYTTYTITSADHTYLTTGTPSSGGSTLPSFTSASSFLASLQQPWSLVLDDGLGTERNYTMNLNLGDLATMDLTPPEISYPLHNSTVNTLNPTFLFATPSPYFATAALGEFNLNFTAHTSLPGGTTSWTPGATLNAGHVYYFDLYDNNVNPAGLGFTAPVDSNQQVIPNWKQSIGSGVLESEVVFTPVPEPSTMVLAALGFVGLVGICRKGRI